MADILQNLGYGLMAFGAGMQDPMAGLKLRQQIQQQQAQQQIGTLLGQISTGNITPQQYNQALGQLAQLDPNTYGGAYLEAVKPMSPLEQLDEQIKRAQLESMSGQRILQEYNTMNAGMDYLERLKRQNNASRVFGTGEPDFGTGYNAPANSPVPPPLTPSDFQSRLGQPTTGGSFKPNPAEISSMIGQGAPVNPVTQEALPPLPAVQPAIQPIASPPSQVQTFGNEIVAQPLRLLNIDEWANSTPEGQAAKQQGDLDKYYSAYADYAKTFRSNQLEASKRQGETAKPTEGNLSASGFVNRMINAEKTLSGLGENAQAARLGPAGYVEQTLAALPLGSFGNRIGEGIIKLASTPEQQVYLKNAEDWIRAKLRKESGAVIADEEMAAEYANYFPMPGDSKEVIADKAARRQVAIQSMNIAAGPSAINNDSLTPKAITTSQGQVTFRVIGQ